MAARLALPVDRRVQVADGIDLRVLDWLPDPDAAPAPDVIAVHGLASNARLWDGMARRLADRGHHVVAVDQRGHGASDKPGSGFDHATLTRDLVDVIAATDLELPVAIGQSWGGNVVLALGRLHPTAVRAVVAVDGGTIDPAATFADADAAWEALAPPDMTTMTLAELAERFGRWMDGWPAEAVLAQLANMKVTPDGRVAPNLSRRDHEAIVRAMYADNPTHWYEEVDVPVLLLPVERDGDGPFVAGTDAALERLPRARAHRFRDRHHDVHAQAPDEVVAVLVEHLDDGFLT